MYISNTTPLHDTMGTATVNGSASHAPIEVSVPLPRAPRTDINIRLHDNGPNITLFLTTSTPDAASSVPLGSLVYAMPNVCAQNIAAIVVHYKLTVYVEGYTQPASQHAALHPQRYARLYHTPFEGSRTKD